MNNTIETGTKLSVVFARNAYVVSRVMHVLESEELTASEVHAHSDDKNIYIDVDLTNTVDEGVLNLIRSIDGAQTVTLEV